MATIQDYQKQLAELYLAFFDRAPDASGMAFWVGHLVSGALTLEAIAKDWWETQAETKAKYPAGLSTSEFVERIYQNVLGRDSDKDGKAFWVKDLDAGKISRDTFIQEIIKGAKAETGGETDRAYLANRTEVSLELLRHDDVIDRDSMAKILKSVDSSKESLQTAKDKVETMSATHNHSSDENVLIVLAKNLIANPDSYADGSIGLLAGVEKNQLSNINNASDKLAPNAIKSIPEAAKNDGDLENLIKAGKVADGAVAKLTGVTNANLEKVVEIMSKLKDGAVQDDIADVTVANIDKITTLGDKLKDGLVKITGANLEDDLDKVVSIAKKLKGEVMFDNDVNIDGSKLESLKLISKQIGNDEITLTNIEITKDNVADVAEIASKLKAGSIAEVKVFAEGTDFAKVLAIQDALANNAIKEIGAIDTDMNGISSSKIANNAINKMIRVHNDTIDIATGLASKMKDDAISYDIFVSVDKKGALETLASKIKNGVVTITDTIKQDSIGEIKDLSNELKDGGGITSLELAQTDWEQNNVKDMLAGKLGADSKAKFTEVTGDFTATAAEDTIVLKKDSANVNITGFHKYDVINFKAIGDDKPLAAKEFIKSLSTGHEELQSEVYMLSQEAADGINDANTLFSKLFGADKHFGATTSIGGNGIKAVIVIGDKFYKVDSNKDHAPTDITVNDIELLGTTKDVSLTLDNIVF